MGSHGPTYFKRYPDRFKKFTPACDTANLQDCTKEQIINTYNNTIVYTDYIIASVIETLKKHNELQSGMLYVSDHGESLGENNIYLHGLPYAIAPDVQKKIPMVLWLSESIETSLGIDKTCLKQQAETKAFSHDNYFHSVLRLLSIKSTAYERSLDIFEKCERESASTLYPRASKLFNTRTYVLIRAFVRSLQLSPIFIANLIIILQGLLSLYLIPWFLQQDLIKLSS